MQIPEDSDVVKCPNCTEDLYVLISEEPSARQQGQRQGQQQQQQQQAPRITPEHQQLIDSGAEYMYDIPSTNVPNPIDHVIYCKICDAPNQTGMQRCSSCNTPILVSYDQVQAELSDETFANSLSLRDQEKYLLMGLQAVLQKLPEIGIKAVKITPVAMPNGSSKQFVSIVCRQCNTAYPASRFNCPKCHADSLIESMRKSINGESIDKTLLNIFSQLFPYYNIKKITNSATLPHGRIVAMKLDLEEDATSVAKMLSWLADFLKAVTKTSNKRSQQLPLGQITSFVEEGVNDVPEVEDEIQAILRGTEPNNDAQLDDDIPEEELDRDDDTDDNTEDWSV